MVVLVTAGCGFQGINSLPLPGTIGRGADTATYFVEIANVGTLEPNSPVLISDVTVGTVEGLTVDNWHATVQVSIEPDTAVAENAVATVGQSSLLGSMHLALNPPPGEQPRGRLSPGATLPLNRSSTFPSTERTLSSLSTIVNGGGLGQISDIIGESNAALSGREPQVRDLLTRLDEIAGVLADQRHDVVVTLEELADLSRTLADGSGAIDAAILKIPAALDVLVRQRPQLTTALDRLRTFSDTATGLIDDTQEDLIRNLRNLEPTLRAVADLGTDLDTVLAYLTTFPFTQNVIDRGMKGDFMNLFVTLDLTYPRIRRTLALGTRFGEPHARLVPAPGDPWFANYTYDPLGSTIVSPEPPQAGAPPAPTLAEPVLPVAPPPSGQPSGQPPQHDQIFAGPYPGAR
ncbi:mammalian cell entry protein [Mycolicibacterium parafortuitum]|uniref:Mammalian cell entry protein n=1 Tax=Mycolicibacterium parafortuitum TaxID=39692 RepID=A0A7I7U758_MYCPF|nr:MCE family protein [Mycolicibacterium parafortuitum]BBY76781.1 mammalian cell entry protein [Mycolicibacterium parafortuitum]